MVNKDLGPPTHHRKPYTSCRALKALGRRAGIAADERYFPDTRSGFSPLSGLLRNSYTHLVRLTFAG